jgi:hypothetical protein
MTHVVGTQPPSIIDVVMHVLGVPVQDSPAVQVPQSRTPPQPSPCMPQVAPSDMQVTGMQELTQVKLVGLQMVLVPQVPQLSVPLQPSEGKPQV